MKSLFEKYDQPVPRYTSYPSVPYWEGNLSSSDWTQSLRENLSENKELSIYVHVPFCESLCTYCGCHQTITKNKNRGSEYVDFLMREFEIYLKAVPELEQSEVVEIHLGGGTPTFLKEEDLERLFLFLKSKVLRAREDFEGSIEIDPRTVSKEKVRKIYDLGFRRVSLGVQDFNPLVQKLIHRIQSYEMVRDVTENCRNLRISSVNFDLIYGLPKQGIKEISHTMDQTLKLRPDRIALYSMAFVPWVKPAQRLFSKEDLPQGEEKRRLYELARERLLSAGYFEIGLDHFALKEDSLYQSYQEKKLHRNFMGYTTRRVNTLLGLGVSSISQTTPSYHQNVKEIKDYYGAIEKGLIPSLTGHQLTMDDQINSDQIRDVMTCFETLVKEEQFPEREDVIEMLSDGLISISGETLRVEEEGRPFLRNICSLFDKRWREKRGARQRFSSL